MPKKIENLRPIAADPFTVGMVLRDYDGYETTVSYVGTRVVTVDNGAFTPEFIRYRWPLVRTQ